MEVTLKRRIASRGWHVYGKTVWQEPKREESVFAKKETSDEGNSTGRHVFSCKEKKSENETFRGLMGTYQGKFPELYGIL